MSTSNTDPNTSSMGDVFAPAPSLASAEPVLYAIGEKLASELAIRFQYHAPRPNQLPRYAQMREEGHKLAQTICELTPPSREQALALTKLEEAIMFANAAIARNERDAKPADVPDLNERTIPGMRK